MALAFDPSSPAPKSSTYVGTTPVTQASNSFSPPAGSVIIVAYWACDSFADTWNTPTITDSLGAHLTWHSSTQYADTTEAGPATGIFWAYTASAQTNMTVSVTVGVGAGQYVNSLAVDVQVWTGANITAPIGATSSGLVKAASLSVNLTPTGTNSALCLTVQDGKYGNNDPTAGSGCYAKGSAGGDPAGAFIWYGTSGGPTLTSSVQTLNATGVASSLLGYVAYEVMAAPTTGPVPQPIPPSIVLDQQGVGSVVYELQQSSRQGPLPPLGVIIDSKYETSAPVSAESDTVSWTTPTTVWTAIQTYVGGTGLSLPRTGSESLSGTDAATQLVSPYTPPNNTQIILWSLGLNPWYERPKPPPVSSNVALTRTASDILSGVDTAIQNVVLARTTSDNLSGTDAATQHITLARTISSFDDLFGRDSISRSAPYKIQQTSNPVATVSTSFTGTLPAPATGGNWIIGFFAQAGTNIAPNSYPSHWYTDANNGNVQIVGHYVAAGGETSLTITTPSIITGIFYLEEWAGIINVDTNTIKLTNATGVTSDSMTANAAPTTNTSVTFTFIAANSKFGSVTGPSNGWNRELLVGAV